MSNMTPKKAFIVIVFNINQNSLTEFLNLLGNLIYELHDNGL